MPNATSVTVKDSANADKIFNVDNPASGTSPASYSLTAASAKMGFRPTIDVVNRPVQNGTNKDRKGLITGYFPIIETINGVEAAPKGTFFKLESKTSTEVSDLVLLDQAILFLNFCRDTLIVKSVANGLNQT